MRIGLVSDGGKRRLFGVAFSVSYNIFIMELEGEKLLFFVQEFLRENEDLVEGYVAGNYSPKDELVDKILEETCNRAEPKEVIRILNQQLAERI